MRNYADFTKWLIEKYKLDKEVFFINKSEQLIIKTIDNLDKVQYLSNDKIVNRPFTEYYHKCRLSEKWIGIQICIDPHAFKKVVADVIDYHAKFISIETIEKIQNYQKIESDKFVILDDNDTLSYLTGYFNDNMPYFDIIDYLNY